MADAKQYSNCHTITITEMSSKDMKYKVVIVDDEPLARRGIRARLKPFSDFTVLEDCEDGVAGLAAIRRHDPDLLFLDIQMPGLNGFEMLKRLPRNRHLFHNFLNCL